VEVESARAAAEHACWAAEHAPDELSVLASMTKAFASDAYVTAAKANIQVHGGIGFTWEHDAHLYFRRATSTAQFLGSPEQHRERVAAHAFDHL
jgi:alkylation response protein AidB-like acyl-CoA dehydrogenase